MLQDRLEARRERVRYYLASARAKAGGSAAHNRKWNSANREKYLAHKVVENAVKSGAMKKQPCERCGAFEKVHAHHDDYSRPREVMWLCPQHHKDRHRELKASADRPDIAL